MPNNRRADIELLEMLEMRDGGMSMRQIADEMSLRKGRPVARDSVLGRLFRVSREANATSCTCVKTENRDGGMPHRWWAQ